MDGVPVCHWDIVLWKWGCCERLAGQDCNDCSNVLLCVCVCPPPNPRGSSAELKEQRKVIQMDLQRQPLTSGSFSPDKAASKGPLARSRLDTPLITGLTLFYYSFFL